jgi:NAD(P)-dependent dehydrogenase (short-subunit alcohol dehydrogenase family)
MPGENRSPGWPPEVLTIKASVLIQHGHESQARPPSVRSGYACTRLPLGRFGEPADYADVILFLASDQSRFVTGQTIAVDGGTLAAGGWYRRAQGRGWTVLPDSP